MSLTVHKQSAIPSTHSGLNYIEVIAALSAKRTCRTYLEVGVSTGAAMNRISTDVAIGVDPGFTLTSDVTVGKKAVHLYRTTSDDFFADKKLCDPITGLIDFAFIDGMHLFEFLLRDIYNVERLCHSRSLIALHDCLPLNEAMIERNFGIAAEKGKDSSFPSYWTGDVWKVIPILKKYRPDLRLIFVETPPTGLVFLTNLDNSSDTLKRNYLNIIDEFKALPNNKDSLDSLYSSINVVRADEILNEFDHSTYFAT
jgi:hypothetical protein